MINQYGVNIMQVYGNLMSRLMENHGTPVLSGAATVCGYSDRHAATVTAVFKKGKYQFVEVQEDTAKRTDNYGMSDMQDYEYERNLNGRVHMFRAKLDDEGNMAENFRKVSQFNNEKNEMGTRWRLVDGGSTVFFGRRDEYYDFSF